MLAMDNFHFDITAWRGHLEFDLLECAMKIAFANNTTASHYRIDPVVLARVAEPRQLPHLEQASVLVFGWNEAMKGSILLPFKLDYVGASDWAKRWLNEQDYGREPDHDGDNSKGWRVFTPEMDSSNYRDPYAFCAVTPAWACHGK